MPQRLSLAGEGVVDVIANRGDLRRRLRGADHEVVGHIGEGAEINHEDVLGVLLQRRARRQQRFGVTVNKLGQPHEAMIR